MKKRERKYEWGGRWGGSIIGNKDRYHVGIGGYISGGMEKNHP